MNFTAYMRVEREPRTLEGAAWAVVAALMAVATAGGLSRGHAYAVVCLVPLAFALAAGKRARSTSEIRQIAAMTSCEGPLLTIFFPGARLIDGRYLDQEYASARDDVESMSFDASGTFRLRARFMRSAAYRDRQLTMQHEVRHAEVSFKVDREGQARLTEFLMGHGYDMS